MIGSHAGRGSGTHVPALRLPPVGLLVEAKAKEDPPVPTPPNPGPPPKPVGKSDTGVSLS